MFEPKATASHLDSTAPRIHGELLKLGFEVAQSSVARYMVKRRGPLSQGWRTFLRNHAPDIAAMDLFVVPTIGAWSHGNALVTWREIHSVVGFLARFSEPV
jgi:hypothetical protein